MATAQASKNRVYLFRLQILIVDGGNLVIKNIFNQKLQSQTLTVCLAQEKQTINRLKNQTIITQTQYDLLFPQSGQAPSIADFDITLTICLLRSLKICGLNPKYNWKSTPQTTDHSVEADITRLRAYRNEIAHISETTGIQLTDFSSKWTDIEQILLRLNSSVPNPVPDLQQTIDDFETCSLDPDEEQRLQKEIDAWREMEKANTQDIISVKQKVDVLTRDTLKNSDLLDDTLKRVDKIEQDKESYKQKRTGVSAKKKSIFERIWSKWPFGKDSRLERDFQDDLIELYRHQHTAIPLSPLIEEYRRLLEFYQMPVIKSVNVQWALGGGKEERTAVEQFSDIFYKDNKICNEIYLTANAGLGKTSLSKRLVLTWCHAKKPIKDEQTYFSKDEIQAMSEFDFVFLLLLRDSSRECDIDELILTEIVSKLKHTKCSLKYLENIMCNKRCLVILDGLDEWTHPPNSCRQGWSYIPHRKARDCTVLTTTRGWKLSAIDLKSSEIDQRLEISGLSQESANRVKRAVISHIHGEKDVNKVEECVKSFNRAVQEKNSSELESIPLLLMYLICLWCDKIELGENQCELHSRIIELLLSRTVKKYKKMGQDLPQVAEYTPSDIPKCFSEQTHCTQFYTLLTPLAQLAFDTLFSNARESTLVFDNSIAEKLLNGEFLEFCLQSGLLTQSKIRGKLTKEEMKISFAHKTVQEFFAALHMHCTLDKNTVQYKVLSKFKSIKDVLEMSNVFIFLSGINVNMSCVISRELLKVINEDEIGRQYRTMSFVYDIGKYVAPLKELQNMYISCLKENPHHVDMKLFCQDIFIDKDCQQEKYYKQLQQLTVQSKENIKSVIIKMEGFPYSVQEITANFELIDLSRVDKIYYQGAFGDCDITPLLHGSVKSLSLQSSKWQDNHLISETGTWSSSVSDRFYSLVNLEAICIHGFKMSHDHLEKLVQHLSARISMREILLFDLSCTDHKDSCTGCSLDMSQHSQLRALTLSVIPLSQLSINVSSLEQCHVGPLSKSGLVPRFLRYLPAASKLHTFTCWYLESGEDIEALLDTVHLLVHVKYFLLFIINLGNRTLTLSPQMVNIEYVMLYKMTMSASTFRDLVLSVHTLPQTVTVHARNCKITPEKEFEREKKKIKSSRDFFVKRDGITQDKKYEFMFRTIKDGD